MVLEIWEFGLESFGNMFSVARTNSAVRFFLFAREIPVKDFMGEIPTTGFVRSRQIRKNCFQGQSRNVMKFY